MTRTDPAPVAPEHTELLLGWGQTAPSAASVQHPVMRREIEQSIQQLDHLKGNYPANEEGVSELDTEKLPALLELKYHSLQDATAELGSVGAIREVFVGFQRGLYA